jgi:uncharacterized membrane protein YcfT
MADRTRTVPGGERLVWMDQVRGAAMVLVILYHGDTIARRFVDGVPSTLTATLAFFAPFRMPLLMFLSGMLLARSLAKPTATYFAGKARFIAFPYVVWSFVFLVVSARLTPRSALAVLVFPPTYLWYLWFLLAYYVAAWAFRRWHVPLIAPMALAFLASFGPDAYRFSRFAFLFVFFCAGSLYATHQDRIDAALSHPGLFVTALAVALSSGIASAAGVPVQYEPIFVASPLAGIVVSIRLGHHAADGAVARALASVGRDSIVYYVTHFTVMWIVCTSAPRLGFEHPVGVYFVAITAAVGVGFSLAWARRRFPVAAALFVFPTAMRRRRVDGVSGRLIGLTGPGTGRR